ARICHAPSTVAMKKSLGVAASTCSYKDWIGSDLLVFFGSNTPNNQPVTTKYLYYAKQQGTRIAVINPYREPGLERYWVPSVFESALFGTKLADDVFSVNTGGDAAFLNGVLKALFEMQGRFDDAKGRGDAETRGRGETAASEISASPRLRVSASHPHGAEPLDREFIHAHTTGFDDVKTALAQQDWELL